MAQVFITGSSDGLGRMAAQPLTEQGHRVVLHARTERRGEEALAAVPGAETVVIGDLASIAPPRLNAPQSVLDRHSLVSYNPSVCLWWGTSPKNPTRLLAGKSQRYSLSC